MLDQVAAASKTSALLAMIIVCLDVLAAAILTLHILTFPSCVDSDAERPENINLIKRAEQRNPTEYMLSAIELHSCRSIVLGFEII